METQKTKGSTTVIETSVFKDSECIDEHPCCLQWHKPAVTRISIKRTFVGASVAGDSSLFTTH
jgi:hypothetical protein